MSELSHNTIWTKLKSVDGIQALILDALILYSLVMDGDVPKWVKATAIAALVYLVDPIDAVPDFIPVAGYLDDLAILAAAIKALHDQVLPRHEQQADQMYSEI